MNIDLTSEFPVTDEACKAMTGRTMGDWIDALHAHGDLPTKRRDAINWMYAEMNKNLFWPTTVWVEMEKRLDRRAKDGRFEGYNICSTKSIKAPLATVFSAWTTAVASSFLGATPDGAGNWIDKQGNRAELKRIRENQDLRYTFHTAGVEDPTEIDVMFAEKDGKVGITLNHNRIQTREEADGLRKAWGEALSALKSLLESA